jgi:hypothetical protein
MGASIGQFAKLLCAGVMVRRAILEMLLDIVNYPSKQVMLNIALSRGLVKAMKANEGCTVPFRDLNSYSTARLEGDALYKCALIPTSALFSSATRIGGLDCLNLCVTARMGMVGRSGALIDSHVCCVFLRAYWLFRSSDLDLPRWIPDATPRSLSFSDNGIFFFFCFFLAFRDFLSF